MADKLKTFFTGLNVFILLMGLVLLAMGVWAILDDVEVINLANIGSDGKYGSFRSPGMLNIMAYLSIFSGFVVFVLAILALCGIKKESKWMLALYAGLMVIILLVLGAVIGLGIVVRERVNNDLKDALFEGIVNHYEGTLSTHDDFSEYYDYAQVQFDCCGIYNYTDFANSALKWIDRYSLQVPKTCCKLDEYQYVYEREYAFSFFSDCAKSPNVTNSHIKKQCYDDIKDDLLTKTYVLTILSCVGAVVLFLGVCLGCTLARKTKEEDGSQTFSHSRYSD